MKKDEVQKLSERALTELEDTLKAGRSETLAESLDRIQKTLVRLIESLSQSQSRAREGERHVA